MILRRKKGLRYVSKIYMLHKTINEKRAGNRSKEQKNFKLEKKLAVTCKDNLHKSMDTEKKPLQNQLSNYGKKMIARWSY